MSLCYLPARRSSQPDIQYCSRLPAVRATVIPIGNCVSIDFSDGHKTGIFAQLLREIGRGQRPDHDRPPDSADWSAGPRSPPIRHGRQTSGPAPGFAGQPGDFASTSPGTSLVLSAESQSCPLLDVTEPGSPIPCGLLLEQISALICLAIDYGAGRLVEAERHPRGGDDFVSFVIGCSFTFEAALQPGRHSRPAYRTRSQRADVSHKHPRQPADLPGHWSFRCAPCGRDPRCRLHRAPVGS